MKRLIILKMKNKKLIVLLLLMPFWVIGQIKGVVKDSLSGKPISFVNISIEGENTGTTSEEDGSFVINSTTSKKFLIFSAIGFEKKKIKADGATVVWLKPKEYQLKEVVISGRKGKKETEIGRVLGGVYQSNENGVRIDVKFFPYLAAYKRTKYLKRISIETDSRIENSVMKIHFYGVDSQGFPADDLLIKDFIVSVKKGTRTSVFDISEFNLTMPKTGLFVGFEKLFIEKNKIEKTITYKNEARVMKTYSPYILYNTINTEKYLIYTNGQWQWQTAENKTASEPAIYVVLCN